MKLYEINEMLEKCIRLNDDMAVDAETGEIIDVEAIDALEMERNEKIRNIVKWIKNLRSDEEQLANEANKFAKRKKAVHNKAEQLSAYLEQNLHGVPFKEIDATVLFRKTKYVDIFGKVDDIPPEYLRVAQPEPNKALIAKAIKNGVDVKGCRLAERLSMSIR